MYQIVVSKNINQVKSEQLTRDNSLNLQPETRSNNLDMKTYAAERQREQCVVLPWCEA